VVTLTEKIWPIIIEIDSLHDRDIVHEVVPCCADLERFKFNSAERSRLRQELGIEGRLVVVYSGSIDGWYLTEEMAEFFVVLRKHNPAAHFLWLTTTKHDRIRKLMKDRAISESDYEVLSASPAEMPSYLSASDVGLAFIKPCFSKLASSPTKYAEYLGCGLPLVINAGIGDSDALIIDDRAGVLVENFTETGYREAAIAIELFVAGVQKTRTHAREIAERGFDVGTVGVQRYARMYEKVLAAAN